MNLNLLQNNVMTDVSDFVHVEVTESVTELVVSCKLDILIYYANLN
jgi:hypothetical protein